MKVLIEGKEYRLKTVADALPDNWQLLVTKRIIASKRCANIINDSDVPKVWERATGRTYDTKKDPCINELRRFLLVCLTGAEIKIDK